MANHNDIGNRGETAAAQYLIKNGYEILHRNWFAGKLELDIVAKKDNWLIVVEVKTRSTDTFEHPQDAITQKKIKNIINATSEYINQFDWEGETRFDVISAIPDGQSFNIDHLEDAFLATM